MHGLINMIMSLIIRRQAGGKLELHIEFLQSPVLF